MNQTTTVDRRVIRTQEAICDALISLIIEKGFKALSVSDITARANINRGTFYLHYRDKYDLIEQTIARIIQDMKEVVAQMPTTDIGEMHNTEEPLNAFVQMFKYIHSHARLMQAIIGLEGDIAFQDQLKKTIRQYLFKIGFFATMKEEDFFVPSEYFVSYIVSAHLGVIQEWLRTGCRESPEEMALLISKLSFYGPIYALGIGKTAKA